MERAIRIRSEMRTIVVCVVLSLGVYILLIALQAFLVVNGWLKDRMDSMIVPAIFAFLAAWLGGTMGNCRLQVKKGYTGILISLGLLACLAILGTVVFGGVDLAGKWESVAAGVIIGGIISTFPRRKRRRVGKRIKK